jgi:TetR/AcrR family transcriptional regulator of autoinduction and epiphytic fitness
VGDGDLVDVHAPTVSIDSTHVNSYGRPVEVVDGRRLRREQNRETVLDALADLFVQGVYEPSTNEIAERAGLSPRSLFRYFDDVDDLHHAVIERELANARPLLDAGVTPGADTRTKIEHLIENRVRLYETIAPAARAARACAHRHPAVAAQLREARSYLRHQIGKLFAPELGGRRQALLPAIDALCSFESHQLLREDQRLSRAKTVSTLVLALGALLDPNGGTT